MNRAESRLMPTAQIDGHNSSEIHYKWVKGHNSIGIQESRDIDTNDYRFT
jgi:hypothetical protein